MKGLVVPLLIVLIIGSAIVPLPGAMLDGLIISNILLALFLLVGSFSVSDPTQFSTLPAILLLGVVSRLLVTISTTRAILTTGDAGAIVAAFGSVMVNDDLLVGCILFIIISIIQFLVVSKGSERVAEVSARFALDALPGRQMSLDADLRAGLLDPHTAQQKRQDLQVESRLYGALDGAMKFIKGDTIATICVTIINMGGGIISGTVRDGKSIAEALHTYTTLSIGDGLAGQIPSLITCVAAGILVTRVPRGDNKSTEADILGQLGSMTKARVLTAMIAVLLACIPGMPRITCLIIGVPLGLSAIFMTAKKEIKAELPAPFSPAPLSLIRVSVSVGQSSAALPGIAVVALLERMRQATFDRFGVILPMFSLSMVTASPSNRTELKAEIQGTTVIVHSPDSEEQDPLTNFGQLLEEVVWRELPTLLNDSMTRALLDLYMDQHGELISLLIPGQMSLSQLTQLLRELLAEGVPIRSFDRLLQALSEKSPLVGVGRQLLEEARIALRRAIIEPFILTNEKLVFGGLSTSIEGALLHAERSVGVPSFALIHEITEWVSARKNTVRGMVVGRGARAILRDILRHNGLDIPVYAREELLGYSYEIEEVLHFGEEENSNNSPAPSNSENNLAGREDFHESFELLQ